MKKLIRQCVGIDVSKDTLDVAISVLDEEFKVSVLNSSQFDNNQKGISKLIKFIKKQREKNLSYQVVLEATGIYHEQLTYTLYNSNFSVAVVLANKIRNYCRSTDVRTVTDKVSAKQIAEFGLVKKLDNWNKPSDALLKIKNLTRERVQLINERTRAKNQKHAKDHSGIKDDAALKRAVKRIEFLDQQVNEIEKEINIIVKENTWLNERVNNICSVKGLGVITVVSVIAETDGFNLIRNCRQLVCYAGYDVVHKESGTSVKSKGKISHKGNKYIRRALHFPAITAAKEGVFANCYNRLFDKQKIKMKSYVAIQRKLLVMIYTLWKNNEKYDKEKHINTKFLGQPNTTALPELDHVRS